MSFRKLLGTAGAVLLTAVTLAAPADAMPGPGLYVSPDGHGTACTQRRPCALETAATKRTGGDVAVYLRGGTYRLTKTLELGRSGGKVSYRAFPGEFPVLSGARRVTGFALFDPAKRIYQAKVPVGTETRQLFVDGVRAERARTPLTAATFTATATGFGTSDPSFTALTNQSEVEVVQENKWKHMRCPLSSITADGTGSALTVRPDCWHNNNTAVVNAQFPFNGNGLPKLDGVSWVENAYQLLSQPGQWYLDRKAGVLSYIPLPGQDMTKADVELPLLETLVDATGTPGHLAPVDDGTATYAGTWATSANRQLGDFGDGVHYTRDGRILGELHLHRHRA